MTAIETGSMPISDSHPKLAEFSRFMQRRRFACGSSNVNPSTEEIGKHSDNQPPQSLHRRFLLITSQTCPRASRTKDSGSVSMIGNTVKSHG